jgi:hypothetical protein
MPAVVNIVRAIEALRPGPKVRYYKVDSNLRLRVATNGAKSFNVRFRVNGRNQEKTLGPYGHLMLRPYHPESATNSRYRSWGDAAWIHLAGRAIHQAVTCHFGLRSLLCSV